MKITKEDWEDEIKGYSFRLPEKVHNKIKAEASLESMTKDKLFIELIKTGLKHYEHNGKNRVTN